jgi:hypothetical protein
MARAVPAADTSMRVMPTGARNGVGSAPLALTVTLSLALLVLTPSSLVPNPFKAPALSTMARKVCLAISEALPGFGTGAAPPPDPL